MCNWYTIFYYLKKLGMQHWFYLFYFQENPLNRLGSCSKVFTLKATDFRSHKQSVESLSTQDLTQDNFTVPALIMLPSPSLQSAFIQIKWPEWGLTKQGKSQSLHQSAKLYWSQWTSSSWLRYWPLISIKELNCTFGIIKSRKAVKFPFPSWIGLECLVVYGNSPDLSASRGKKDLLWCCGWALPHEKKYVMPWEVLIWSVVLLFSFTRVRPPRVETNM